MSLLDVNELSPNQKVLTGCGDGVRNGHRLNNPFRAPSRTPVPSCRRFCTRPSIKHRNESVNVRAQLQKAINDLAVHPNITRRRALTMAEINPTRSCNKKDGLPISSPGARGTGGAKALVASAPRREEDAGRRVYQLLLLNAWRRRRTQVATLSESHGALETQNGNLQLQVDALKQLRMAECEKRAEAVAGIQILQEKMGEMLEESQILKEEKTVLEEDVKLLEDKLDGLHVELQNSQNNNMTTICELRNIEHQLGIERGKINKLREENQSLLDQLSRKVHDVTALHDQVQDLQEKLLDRELQLQDMALNNNACEKDKQELLETLNKEIVMKTDLQKQLHQSTAANANLEVILRRLKTCIKTASESRRKIQKDNEILKKSLAEVTDALIKEQQQPWWKNASKLASISFSTLKYMARMMLPAIPSADWYETSSLNAE